MGLRWPLPGYGMATTWHTGAISTWMVTVSSQVREPGDLYEEGMASKIADLINCSLKQFHRKQEESKLDDELYCMLCIYTVYLLHIYRQSI